jgi:DNA polymerase III delta subunit
LTDGDFGGLVGELEKLTLLVEPGQPVSLNDVRKLTSSYEEFTIFSLTDAIAEGKTDNALKAYDDLILKGNRPTTILWQISNHMFNLLKIHTGKRVLGAQYFIQKLKNQSRLFKLEKALKAIVLVAGAEREIRQSIVKPVVLVENVIRNISR